MTSYSLLAGRITIGFLSMTGLLAGIIVGYKEKRMERKQLRQSKVLEEESQYNNVDEYDMIWRMMRELGSHYL